MNFAVQGREQEDEGSSVVWEVVVGRVHGKPEGGRRAQIASSVR